MLFELYWKKSDEGDIAFPSSESSWSVANFCSQSALFTTAEDSLDHFILLKLFRSMRHFGLVTSYCEEKRIFLLEYS